MFLYATTAKAWGKLCHRIDVSYPSSNVLKVVDISDKMQYALRHAVAAYGPAMLLLFGVIGPTARQFHTFGSHAFKSTTRILDSTFQIAPEDVIMDNLEDRDWISTTEVHDPSFYLVVDRARRLIVLSISGTSSVADALTDLDGIAEAHTSFDIDGDDSISGYVHPGFFQAAKTVKAKVHDKLMALCNKFKDFQIIFTGHSLGAGLVFLRYVHHVD